MFDKMKTKVGIAEEVEWLSPSWISIKFKDNDDTKQYKLLKGAKDFLHKKIDLKPSTSDNVFKKSNTIWRELRDTQLEACNEELTENEQFRLDSESVVYLYNEADEIVDIYDFKTEDRVEEFKNKHHKYDLSISTFESTRKMIAEGKMTKLVCYDKEIDIVNADYVPVVFVECNPYKSTFNVCSGIFLYKKFVFLPSIAYDIESKSLCEFIEIFDTDSLLKFSTENGKEFYDNYKSYVNNPIEISVRELNSLFKKIGYKLELEEDNKLSPIKKLQDEDNNVVIQDFYNTFVDVTGETTYDILKLSELKKTFRYNKLTLLDVLGILSKEYLCSDNDSVDINVIGDIVYKLHNKRDIDKLQSESVKREIK